MGRKRFSQMFPKGSAMSVNVATARDIARKLISAESRGPGDIDNAMRRLEARRGVPYTLLKALRFRPPKDILLGQWMRLVEAYEMECARQERLYRLERETARALKDATSKSMVRAADFISGQKAEEAD